MIQENSEQKKFGTGTTTVGIVYDKGVLLAADKRATMGSFIASKEVEKIIAIGYRIAITTAGGVGDAQSLSRLLRAELEMYKYASGEPLSIQGSATLLANVLQGSKYFPYIVQIIIGGYDTAPRLYDVDLFGGLLEEKYTSTGSGSIVAYGVLDDGFKESMKEEDAVELAKRAIRAAIKRDSASGEGIDVVAITRDSIKRYKTAPVTAELS